MQIRIKLTTEQFIEKANLKHNFKFNYSKVKFTKMLDKVCIICPVHGEFWQEAHSHLKGIGCSSCSNKKRLTKEQFIQKARKIHGNKYIYDFVEYKNNSTKVKIVCKKHGIFEQSPNDHLSGCNCKECSFLKTGIEKSLSNDDFLSRIKQKHGDKYDYSLVKYKHSQSKVKVICYEHGEFEIYANNFMLGFGCKKCSDINNANRKRKSKKDFILQAQKIHNDKYCYDEVEYLKNNIKVKIKCKKCNKIFLQRPQDHLKNNGCPFCVISKGEEEIKKFLDLNNMNYSIQEWFKNTINPCRNPETKSKLPFDFYLSEYNMCIEFDGWQHFKPHSFNLDQSEDTKLKNLEKLKYRDQIKTQFCEDNNIKLLRIPYWKFSNIHKILSYELL